MDSKISIRDEAELVMAVRDYSCEKRGKWDDGIDIAAFDQEANEKILLRIVTSDHKSGSIGIDAVRKMQSAMESGYYDKGFLFGKRFTDAARHETTQSGIRIVSEEHKPHFKPERLYMRINHYVNTLCKEMCGRIPKEESDCRKNCKVRTISDNASYHFEQGWIKLMKNDLKQLLSMQNSKV
jgi:hypothetical protein